MGCPEANVENAQALLEDFTTSSTEEKYGVIEHAIAELENARRDLPDDI